MQMSSNRHLLHAGLRGFSCRCGELLVPVRRGRRREFVATGGGETLELDYPHFYVQQRVPTGSHREAGRCKRGMALETSLSQLIRPGLIHMNGVKTAPLTQRGGMLGTACLRL